MLMFEKLCWFMGNVWDLIFVFMVSWRVKVLVNVFFSVILMCIFVLVVKLIIKLKLLLIDWLFG